MLLVRSDIILARELLTHPPVEPRHYNALFISDVHLGADGCNAEALLDFFKYHTADVIYYVGDIIDFEALHRTRRWPQSHSDIVQKALRSARKGAKITYIPGNHDDCARPFAGFKFGDITIALNAVHEAADGRRYLVTHGDQFDSAMTKPRWVVQTAGAAYDIAVVINRAINNLQRRLGLPTWSLARWLKHSVKEAVTHIADFEKSLVAEAQAAGLDGVIAGHIHYAAIHHRHGLAYMNCGDWVEDCTAIGELEDGSFEIIDWSDRFYQTQPYQAYVSEDLLCV